MWFVFAVLTFLFWGFADLFYKKGNSEKDKYSHLKTGVIIGFTMGLHAIIYYLVKDISISFLDILKYLPVSLCYIISMVIGYKGLKYINLSISSPIQNTSGIITSLLLCIIFQIIPSVYEIIGLLLMLIGVIILSIIENKSGKEKQDLLKKIKISVILFPILYCIIDGMGTFLDAIYLDQLSLISEDAALISYELTFLIYGIIVYLYLHFIKKEKIIIKNEKNKVFASLFETAGQFTYVYAITSHSIITVPIVACYSALSILLSRIFLKEKLTKFQYIALLLIFIGIIVLGIFEA